MTIHYFNVIIFLIIFYINHKGNLLKRIPYLLIGTLVVFVIFSSNFNEFSLRTLYISLGIAAIFDFMLILLSKGREKKVNK